MAAFAHLDGRKCPVRLRHSLSTHLTTDGLLAYFQGFAIASSAPAKSVLRCASRGSQERIPLGGKHVGGERLNV